VFVVGCGGLGTVSAGLLARAGVGHLRLVDSNRVEFANLTGQVLFDEEDAQAGRESPARCFWDRHYMKEGSAI